MSILGHGRAVCAAVLPYSASPTRQDPRPPTCRSIGADLAASLRGVADGDVALQRECLESMRAQLPTAAWPVSEPSKEDKVAAQLLQSMRAYVDGPLQLTHRCCPSTGKGGGTREKCAQQALHTIAAAVHSTEVEEERNTSTALDLTGLTRHMWKSGGTLRAENCAAAAAGSAHALGE